MGDQKTRKTKKTRVSYSYLRSVSGYGSVYTFPSNVNTANRHYSIPNYDDTVHYITPQSPLSARSRYEGDYGVFDYMELFSEKAIDFKPELSTTTISSSYISCAESELQRTLALVKPEAMFFRDTILRAIFQAGFQIIDSRTMHLTPEQVSELYGHYYGTPSFPHLVVSVSSNPVLVVCIAANNVIAKWKEILGADGSLREDWFYPMSMRTRFGLHATIPHAIHASENLKESNKDNRYFFPNNILEPLTSEPEKVVDYCGLYVNPTLLNGLTELVKTKPVDPILFLAEWLLLNNPYQPRLPIKIAVLPT